MSNSNIFRMDIWEADFKHSYKSVICGKHPCIILSNFKTNVRNYGTVNVIPLTSNLIKYLNVHINLNGYKLKESSKALCNEIQTIDKSSLCFKIGKIDDVCTQLEIEKAILSQMNLNKNYIDTENIEELENYFIGNIKNMNNVGLYNKLKSEIIDLAYKSENEECVISCNKLIEAVLNSNTKDKLSFLWYGYYHRALMFNRLNHYDLALADVKESLKYTGNLKEGLNDKYSYSMWLLSYTLENLNNIEKAIEIYKNLEKYYKNMGRLNLRIDMLYNVARLNENSNRMYTLIQIVEKIDFSEFNTNKTKEGVLKQMYEDYFKLKDAIN